MAEEKKKRKVDKPTKAKSSKQGKTETDNEEISGIESESEEGVQASKKKRVDRPKKEKSSKQEQAEPASQNNNGIEPGSEEVTPDQKGVIKQGTIAEFMRKRTQLVGFDMGLYKHTQYMAEFMDNALDAIEINYWKDPKIYQLKEDLFFEYPKPKELLRDAELTQEHIVANMKELLAPLSGIINTEPLLVIRIQEIEKPEMLSDDQSGRDIRMFSFECFDSGIGLVPQDLEKFGKYLASSKSEQLKQTRGSQGFGASSAFSDAQNTTGRPISVISRHAGNPKAVLTTFFT
ncbi:MAG: hypothetical protein LUQ65_06310, partial [Candidatus Helarchaeota archaeon]|nr:hypothetical protein [Candidatus Helarchaeota archaeon]